MRLQRSFGKAKPTSSDRHQPGLCIFLCSDPLKSSPLDSLGSWAWLAGRDRCMTRAKQGRKHTLRRAQPLMAGFPPALSAARSPPLNHPRCVQIPGVATSPSARPVLQRRGGADARSILQPATRGFAEGKRGLGAPSSPPSVQFSRSVVSDSATLWTAKFFVWQMQLTNKLFCLLSEKLLDFEIAFLKYAVYHMKHFCITNVTLNFQMLVIIFNLISFIFKHYI